mgnify:CR=1 FL=1
MSVFEKFFKLNDSKINEQKMNLLMEVTNNKMSLKVYKAIDEQVMKKMPKNVQVIEAMDMLKELKGNWLTEEEKENFVAGAWMFETLDTTNPKNCSYINSEQLKYVKQAVLGTQFQAAKQGKYYAEIKEYKLKY